MSKIQSHNVNDFGNVGVQPLSIKSRDFFSQGISEKMAAIEQRNQKKTGNTYTNLGFNGNHVILMVTKLSVWSTDYWSNNTFQGKDSFAKLYTCR